MNIVAITEEHWEDLRNIRLASLKDSPVAFGLSYEEAISFSSENWKLRASGHEGPRFLILYNDSKPVGLVGGVFANGEYELIAMWVSPEYRSSGAGFKLVEALKKHALSESHCDISLRVSPDNKPACHLYEKCGFTVVGEVGSLASNSNINLQKMAWHQTPSPNK